MEEKKNLTDSEKDKEIARLQAELDMALAFNKVAVAERNLAWAREAKLTAEVKRLNDVVFVASNTLNDIRRGFAAGVDPSRWVDEVQAHLKH